MPVTTGECLQERLYKKKPTPPLSVLPGLYHLRPAMEQRIIDRQVVQSLEEVIPFVRLTVYHERGSRLQVLLV